MGHRGWPVTPRGPDRGGGQFSLRGCPAHTTFSDWESACPLSQGAISVVICYGGPSGLVCPPTWTFSCRGPPSCHRGAKEHTRKVTAKVPQLSGVNRGGLGLPPHKSFPPLLVRPGGCPPCTQPPQGSPSGPAPPLCEEKTQAPGQRIPGDTPEKGLQWGAECPSLGGGPLSKLLVLSLCPEACPQHLCFHRFIQS